MKKIGLRTLPTGIDVSAWNGDIAQALKGCEFAFVRASYGAVSDTKYGLHSARVRAAGLVLGAYHFVVPGPGDGRQAATFLARAGDADILAIDDEAAALHYPELTQGIIANVRRLDTRQRPIILYASQSNFPGNLGQDGNWIARWGTRQPSLPLGWSFWQYQGAPLDRDVFNGSLVDLYRLAGRTP